MKIFKGIAGVIVIKSFRLKEVKSFEKYTVKEH